MYLHSKTKLPPPGCLPFTAKQTIKSTEVGEEKQQKCKKVSLFSLTKQNRTPGRSSVLGPAVFPATAPRTSLPYLRRWFGTTASFVL